MKSDLFGPDVSDEHTGEPIEEQMRDTIEVWSRQFCNRWVFLPHQRSLALHELRELIAEARKT